MTDYAPLPPKPPAPPGPGRFAAPNQISYQLSLTSTGSTM